MVQNIEEFKNALDNIDSLHIPYIKRFSRHPYLGYEHFSSLLDVGTTITSFAKIERKNTKKALSSLGSKFELNRLGAIQRIEKPMSETRWTYFLISEQNLHFVNGLFPLGFSVSIESIENLNIKKKKVTYVEVEMECEISNSTYKNISVGKTDLTFRLPKDMMNNFFSFIDVFKYLKQEIKNENILVISIHKARFDKESEGKSISVPYQDMNYMMNVVIYIHKDTGEIVMTCPSNALIAFEVWSEEIVEMADTFVNEAENYKDELKETTPKEFVKSELFKNIDSVLHHSGINENIEVLKGDEFIIGKTV